MVGKLLLRVALLASLTVGVSSADAAIGNSRDELITQFGEPKAEGRSCFPWSVWPRKLRGNLLDPSLGCAEALHDATFLTFAKDEVNITAVFFAGRCVAIGYKSAPTRQGGWYTQRTGYDERFQVGSHSFLPAFLEANHGASSWPSGAAAILWSKGDVETRNGDVVASDLRFGTAVPSSRIVDLLICEPAWPKLIAAAQDQALADVKEDEQKSFDDFTGKQAIGHPTTPAHNQQAAPRVDPSIAPTSSNVWLIPDSSTRRLSAEELSAFNSEMLWRARNELYARHGFIFSGERGQHLARSLGTVYRGTDQDQERVFRSMGVIEQENVRLITRFEAATKEKTSPLSADSAVTPDTVVDIASSQNAAPARETSTPAQPPMPVPPASGRPNTSGVAAASPQDALPTAQPSPEDRTAPESYKDVVNNCRLIIEGERKKLRHDYLQKLRSASAARQVAGDLDTVLQLRAEIERVKKAGLEADRNILDRLPSYASLAKLRPANSPILLQADYVLATVVAATEVADVARAMSVNAVKQLTTVGRLEEAVTAQAQIKQLEQENDLLPLNTNELGDITNPRAVKIVRWTYERTTKNGPNSHLYGAMTAGTAGDSSVTEELAQSYTATKWPEFQIKRVEGDRLRLVTRNISIPMGSTDYDSRRAVRIRAHEQLQKQLFVGGQPRAIRIGSTSYPELHNVYDPDKPKVAINGFDLKSLRRDHFYELEVSVVTTQPVAVLVSEDREENELCAVLNFDDPPDTTKLLHCRGNTIGRFSGIRKVMLPGGTTTELPQFQCVGFEFCSSFANTEANDSTITDARAQPAVDFRTGTAEVSGRTPAPTWFVVAGSGSSPVESATPVETPRGAMRTMDGLTGGREAQAAFRLWLAARHSYWGDNLLGGYLNTKTGKYDPPIKGRKDYLKFLKPTPSSQAPAPPAGERWLITDRVIVSFPDTEQARNFINILGKREFHAVGEYVDEKRFIDAAGLRQRRTVFRCAAAVTGTLPLASEPRAMAEDDPDFNGHYKTNGTCLSITLDSPAITTQSDSGAKNGVSATLPKISAFPQSVSVQVVKCMVPNCNAAEQHGNVVVMYADGHQEVLTRDGNAIDAKLAAGRTIGWTSGKHEDGGDRYGQYFANDTLLIYRIDRVVTALKAECGFIEDWRFGTGDTVVVKSRGRHGPAIVQVFELTSSHCSGRIVANAITDLSPEWTRGYGE